jgi:cell division protein FtsB
MAKKRIIYIAIAVLAVIAIFLPGFSKLQELKEENRNLERRLEILKKANKELKEEKERLENDPTYVEKIAREKLGMARQGEIILK